MIIPPNCPALISPPSSVLTLGRGVGLEEDVLVEGGGGSVVLVEGGGGFVVLVEGGGGFMVLVVGGRQSGALILSRKTGQVGSTTRRVTSTMSEASPAFTQYCMRSTRSLELYCSDPLTRPR